MRAILLFLLLATHLHGAGLGVYNPAQHAVNGFMPTQLPGLQVWLDASRLGGLTNSQSVASFFDFSGLNRTFTNGTSSQQPIYGPTLFNGRPAVKWDGVDDYLIMNDNVPVADEVVAMVFRQRNGTSGVYARYYTHIATNYVDDYNNTLVPILNGNSTNAVGSWRSGVKVTHTVNHNENVVFIMTMTAAGGLTNYKNGSVVGTTIASQNYGTKNNFVGGATGLSGGYCNADIAEVIVLNKWTASDSVLLIQRYLGTKYGIVVQ